MGVDGSPGGAVLQSVLLTSWWWWFWLGVFGAPSRSSVGRKGSWEKVWNGFFSG